IAKGWALFTGNYITRQGAAGLAVLPGGRPALFTGAVWSGLQAIAFASGVVLAYVVGVTAAGAPGRLHRFSGGSRGALRQRRPPQPPRQLLALFALFSAVLVAAYALFVRAAVWDRHLWPVAFAVAVLLLVPRAEKRPVHFRAVPRLHLLSGFTRVAREAATIALGGVLAVVAVAVTLNADAYDSARWRAGQLAVRAGFSASDVDAGFEWVGSHAHTSAVRGREATGAPAYETWYDQMFRGFRDCAFVSGSGRRAPDLAPMGTVSYDLLGVAVPERLYLYTVRIPGCAPTPNPDHPAEGRRPRTDSAIGLNQRISGNRAKSVSAEAVERTARPLAVLAPPALGH
ncbi:MAG TPA: hypothetical protein VED59_01675, partial [Acidimicrobiales bacterium]|nr:hypothetical protein [Acidimicrobiales bacterium]